MLAIKVKCKDAMQDFKNTGDVTTKEIDNAALLLRQGELVAFPTETVYGLGADATDDLAVAKIFAAKGRPDFNPLIIHMADRAAIDGLVRFNETAAKLAERFWPGALTLVLPRKDNCPVSRLASAGLDTLAVRMPAHPLALALLKACGKPVAAPSANPSGGISPTRAAHVRRGLGDKVAAILDGGPCPVGVESTVIGFDGDQAVLLRPGGIAREDIEAVTGPLIVATGDSAVTSPGMLESHYAPGLPVRLNATAPAPGEAWLGFGDCPDATLNLSTAGDVTEAAANLFAMLHRLDGGSYTGIAVAPIPDAGLGLAINDRLRRAAAPRPTTKDV